MTAWLAWVLAGLAALGAELVLPGAFLLWVGLAAVGTGLVALLFDPGFVPLAVIFLGLLAGGIATALRLRRQRGAAARVNAPEAGLAGRVAVVLATEGAGLRVRLGDSDWPARLPRGAAAVAVGQPVRVEAVDGTTLVVRALDGSAT
ncbi:MAG TPA: NfeD family protein [Acetobacteraceae bacterium]|nr:NfeD family protein [Acetobacteraceae bacterium]